MSNSKILPDPNRLIGQCWYLFHRPSAGH